MHNTLIFLIGRAGEADELDKSAEKNKIKTGSQSKCGYGRECNGSGQEFY
jgi:hypothetical protein